MAKGANDSCERDKNNLDSDKPPGERDNPPPKHDNSANKKKAPSEIKIPLGA